MSNLIFLLLFNNQLVAAPTNSNWKNEVLYYIFIDRFNDANKDNNIPLYAFPTNVEDPKERKFNLVNQYWMHQLHKDEAKSALKTDPKKIFIELYYGGDIQGIIEKLDYLADLGVTAIMLSPIVDNVNATFPNSGNTGYHGYWAQDWFYLDEHFANAPEPDETLHEARSGDRLITKLINEAHKRGLKVLLDLSYNQTSPALLDESLADDNQVIENKKNYFKRGQPVYNLPFSPLLREGIMQLMFCYPEKNKTCRNTLDTSGFFNSHEVYYNGDDRNYEELKSGQLHSLPDINQRNPSARQYILESITKWAKLGFDGYRIDAVKHIYEDFVQEMIDAILSIDPNSLIVGEYFDGGIYNPDSVKWLLDSRGTTMFDFSFATAMRNYFTSSGIWNSTPADFAYILESQNNQTHSYNALGAASLDLITFINNHDLPRFMTLKGATYESYEAALIMLLTSRGVPKLTQGDEISSGYPYNSKLTSLLGTGGDPWCRLPMEWEFLDTPEKFFTNSDNVRRDTYSKAKRLIHLRKQNDFFRKANTKFIDPNGLFNWFHLSSSFPYLAYTRWTEGLDESRFYYFYSKVDKKLCYDVVLSDGDYRDLLIPHKVYQVRDNELCHEFRENEVVTILTKGPNNISL